MPFKRLKHLSNNFVTYRQTDRRTEKWLIESRSTRLKSEWTKQSALGIKFHFAQIKSIMVLDETKNLRMIPETNKCFGKKLRS